MCCRYLQFESQTKHRSRISMSCALVSVAADLRLEGDKHGLSVPPVPPLAATEYRPHLFRDLGPLGGINSKTEWMPGIDIKPAGYGIPPLDQTSNRVQGSSPNV